MKILIVDDNQTVATVVRMILEVEGHEVRSALNGPDGYLAYLQMKPDLVITDIQMPGENGFELIHHIREHDPAVKTIYMSGNLDEYYSDLEKEKSLYSINCLPKPFSREDLMGRVSSIFS